MTAKCLHGFTNINSVADSVSQQVKTGPNQSDDGRLLQSKN